MFLATSSTKRPVAMGCLIIALIVLGINSYKSISLENMPSVDIPYVTITTVWLGASPEDMEKDVAKYIEDAVSGVEGLKHINSLCLENVCNVVVEFDLSVDVDVAAQNVREKIDGVLSDLPPGAERPVIEKLDINATSVATLFLSGTQTVDDLYDYADNELSDRFATVKGVASVNLIGGNQPEIWVELDRDKLAAAGLTSATVVSVLKNSIMTVPGGRLRDSGSEYSLRFDADTYTVESINQLEIAASNGARRYLSDLGSVRMATEEIRQRAFLNGVPGITIKVVKKSDGNTVEVVNEIKKRFERLSETLPSGMKMDWILDDGNIVQSTVDSTTNDIVSAVLLCAGILFAFLINIRTTFIVSITMPVTIIISLFFMKLGGQTLNISTMLAIGLSAGILVSNSIVVLENVVRRFEDTPNKWDAACIGTSQMTVAVLASAGTNVVVMIPIAMMSSIVGRFFAPFALTTLIVNIASIFISFTLTPILCALFMRKESEKTGPLSTLGRKWDAGFDRLALRYGKELRAIGSRRMLATAVVVLSILFFFFSMSFGMKGVGFTFTESDDWGRIFVRCEFPSYYSLERTTTKANEVADMMSKYDDLDDVLVSVGKADAIGGQANEGVYLAQIELVFKSVYERKWKLEEVLAQIRRDLATVPDAILSASVPGITGGSDSSLEMNLRGPDLDELTNRARALQRELMKNPGIAQLDTTARDDKPEIKVIPNRPVLADFGITPSTLGSIIRGNVDGIQAASFKNGDKTINIRVKLLEQAGIEQVPQFMIPGKTGYPVPLETVADIRNTQSKIMIYRVDKERTVKLVGNETPGYASATILEEMYAKGEEIGTTAGIGYEFDKSGTAEMMGEAVSDFGSAILMAIILTYLMLSAILESFVRPFIVLLTIPMALIGIAWALRISGMNISIFVLLGVVLLIGVVVNAAIIIVDRLGQLIAAGKCKRDAMYEAVEQTFRAVLMVIAASGLGMMPIAMASGIGAVNRIGIGAASVGGIVVSGLLTITVLPLVYVFFTRKSPKKSHNPQQ